MKKLSRGAGGGLDVNIVKDSLVLISHLWYIKDTLQAHQSLTEESLFFKKAAYTYMAEKDGRFFFFFQKLQK